MIWWLFLIKVVFNGSLHNINIHDIIIWNDRPVEKKTLTHTRESIKNTILYLLSLIKWLNQWIYAEVISSISCKLVFKKWKFEICFYEKNILKIFLYY
jgi:hypothetical protein